MLQLCSFLLVSIVVIEATDVITNHWYVRVRGGQRVARDVAKRNGYTYISQVLDNPLDHHFIHYGLPKIRARRSISHLRALKQDPDVMFAEQLAGYGREKRGYKKYTPNYPTKVKETSADQPKDPLFKHEWYLHNTGQAGGVPHLDLNVLEAWDKGITGKGVTTAIMDDGIDYMHPDLTHNFNAEASFDYSSNDPYPYPRYTDDWFNSHGTRCAGEIAAARDNNICGVGVAYGSQVAGLRMLDQPYMTDLIEAYSMSHEPNIIDIYSASWGPTDDGRTVDGPRNATMRAIVKGVNEGRNGKGNIYVWASGDGGPLDDCNCDGYAASMWTISINSATNDGSVASYDESCSSTLASTFSNGKQMFADAGVATTDLYGNCTLRHSGTSAAAPEAAGVFALALEANPSLTWRDMQHLVVLTSKRRHLEDPHRKHSWQENGAKLLFNHLFGYGVLDAGSIVDLAKRWQSVPERYHCTAGTINGSYTFTEGESLVLRIDTEACSGQENEVNFLEHVQSFITVKASRRGDVTMYLTSPMNTTSMLLSRRPKDDDSHDGFLKWPFMTTQSWAEQPRGIWTLEVRFDRDAKNWYGDGFEGDQGEREGALLDWSLVLHGTRRAPYEGIEDPEGRHVKLNVVRREHSNAYFKAH